ncbi:MAG: response regulator [Promethearchaeota archaeon]
MITITDNIKKTEEMEKYEEETGRQAIWQGELTKGFERWKDGEKNYYGDKKRISVYVSRETEKNWQDFIKNVESKTLSKLIRVSVNEYIKEKLREKGNFSLNLDYQLNPNAMYYLKQRVTIIKGFLQLILEKYKLDLNEEIVSIVENILDHTQQLENKFISKKDKASAGPSQFDVLLIEDDLLTVELLTNYFISKGYLCKGVYTGASGLEELVMNTPKLILLDIILPDVSGFDICKQIKQNEKFKDIPIIFLTAIPGFKVQEKMEETQADGYILKPFDLVDFEFLFNYL